MDDAKRTYEYFWVSIMLKGAISIIEVISGTAALLIPPGAIASLVTLLTQHELSEEPNDFVSTHLVSLAHSFSTSLQIFVGIYLLSRGLVKVFLIAALLKNKLWAYPVSLVVLSLFLLYQFYQIITSHSLVVVAITLFDIVVMYFIWKEWQLVKKGAARDSLGI